MQQELNPSHKARFDRLCREAMRIRPNLGDAGIGTLAEKCMHAVIKQYLCADVACHEVKVPNTRFVSDVRIGREVFEVQTGAFYPMKKKIDYYLTQTDYTVTVVHPIAAERWMSWVDPKSMEIKPRRRVSKKGRAIDLLPELYALLPHLQNPRLRFQVLLLQTYDFRLLDGTSRDRKRGSTHYERIPLSLLGEMSFFSPDDFRVFLPEDLPAHFTVKNFSAKTGLYGRDAYSAVRALTGLGLFTSAEPIGRSMGWRRSDLAESLPNTDQTPQT